MKPPRYSVKDVQYKIKDFKQVIKNSKSVDDLILARSMLELYLRAIEKHILNYPLSVRSRKLLEAEHKDIFKYD